MTVEQGGIPEWAQQERQRDRAWISDNLHVFVPAAHAAFQELGRGAFVVDTSLQPATEQGNPFAYVPQAEIEALSNEDIMRMVQEYHPGLEFVLVMLKPHDRTSSYRVQPFRRVPDGPSS